MTEKIIKVIDLVPGNIAPLATVQADSLNEDMFWADFVCKHRPLLIKGGAKEWPAFERWKNPGYLESLCGEEMVGISRMFNPLPSGPYFGNVVKRRMLAECINEMRNSPDDATYSIPSMRVPEKWEGDLGRYSFLGKKFDKLPRFYPRRRLFLYKNASTEWHYHPIDESITAQLAGRKRISLFRLTPTNWPLYSQLVEANLHHLHCGRQFFPGEMGITKYEGMLEAGDAVYIPPFWWHGIDPADADVGCTMAYCFRTPIHRFGDWKEPATRKMLQYILASQKRSLAPVLALIACSSLTRKFTGEKW